MGKMAYRINKRKPEEDGKIYHTFQVISIQLIGLTNLMSIERYKWALITSYYKNKKYLFIRFMKSKRC